MKRLKILIGCEESGTIRDEFLKRGHDAISCDLLPSRSPGPHLQMDIMEAIKRGGDLVILHPDCTKMALCGNRWWAGTKEREEAIAWTAKLWQEAKKYFDRACLEQPKSSLVNALGKSYQRIQPWQFGDGEVKETWLWLHRLPPLVHTKLVCGREPRVWKMAPGPNRARDRSVSYGGVARAMAAQWGYPSREVG